MAASDATDTRWASSNYDSAVDLYAPGVNIRSAYYLNVNESWVASGTSMACPYVSGAAAQFLQSSPLATPQVVLPSSLHRDVAPPPGLECMHPVPAREVARGCGGAHVRCQHWDATVAALLLSHTYCHGSLHPLHAPKALVHFSRISAGLEDVSSLAGCK